MENLKKRHSGKVDMLSGSLADKILLFALPLAASSILQQLFNSADIAVVGRFAGSAALAAVGSNGSVISLIINLFAGLSVGANVVIANLIGQGEKGKLNKVVHTVVSMALISGFILIALGQALAKPLLLLMDTPEDVINLAVLYLRIYFAGMPFMMVYNFGAAILRSTGDSKRPLLCLVVSGVINVCLNLVFVIVFGMGVAGVGIATVTANAVSSGLIVYFLTHEEEAIRLDLKKLSLNKNYVIKIIKIGAPAGIQGMVFSLSNVCIQTAVNSFGSDAVAGSASALNFEYFVFFVINAFSQTAVTFTGQNFGAKKYDRCKRIFALCMLFAVCVSGVMSFIFVFGRDIFIRLYTTDPTVIEYAEIRMIHALTLEFLPATYEISGACLRGMGRSMLPAVLTVLGSCVFRFVWVFTVFKEFGSFGALMNVYPASWLVTGIAVLAAYFIIRKKLFAKNI